LVLHNPEAERIFERLELSPKVLQRRSVLDLMRDVLPDSITSLPDIGGVLEMHLGDVGEYLVHIAPIARVEGIREQFVAVAQDVTELRRVDRMKSNLTRVLTHDLGSMMMLVRNPLELLEEPDLLPDQRDHLRAMLTGSLERMSRLIKDVQDLEMASALGRDTMQPYDLVEIIGDVCARNQALAEKEGLTFAYEEESRPKQPLIGHPFLVAQAIDNLVNNAVKYTPAGGAVTLTLLMEADQAVIRVQDTGLGIPADRLQLIFDPFYRVKSKETVHIQGTGMGLSLVRTIAELHGGQVTVSSTPGEGSVFTLMLPPEPTVEDPAANSHLFQLDLSGFLDIVLKRRNAGPGQPDSVPV
jgi:signal transduction histidine kinase